MVLGEGYEGHSRIGPNKEGYFALKIGGSEAINSTEIQLQSISLPRNRSLLNIDDNAGPLSQLRLCMRYCLRHHICSSSRSGLNDKQGVVRQRRVIN